MLPSTTAGLRTIVIDPGHGGDDTGATGAKGTLEKDVALAIARRVEGGARGAARRAHPPHARRRCRRAARRPRVARQQQQGRSVRQHPRERIRAAVGRRRRGVLRQRRAVRPRDGQRARRRRRRADAGVRRRHARDRRSCRGTARSRTTSSESAAAARLFEAALRQAVPMNPRALQQAPLRVLVGANMPAVLVEVGYLTNAEQEDAAARR